MQAHSCEMKKKSGHEIGLFYWQAISDRFRTCGTLFCTNDALYALALKHNLSSSLLGQKIKKMITSLVRNPCQ